jgi:hypothetical protein
MDRREPFGEVDGDGLPIHVERDSESAALSASSFSWTNLPVSKLRMARRSGNPMRVLRRGTSEPSVS